MKRIIVHWTAGGSRASSVDKEHYHRLVEHDGTIVAGTEAIEDNIVTSDGDYAAHTRNLNAGSIGVALCGMRGAVEYPFNAGPSPLTADQWRAACILVAELALQYSIPISRETVLTHAEVEPTLGVKQRGKWDIARLPFRPDIVGAIPVGDHLRQCVSEVLQTMTGQSPVRPDRPTLRMGDRGQSVSDAQSILAHLGYHLGRIDGIYGARTREGVLAFQADNGLVPDGVVGGATWAALMNSPVRPERSVTESDLRAGGSQTIAAADAGETEAKAGAGVMAAAGVAEVVTEAGGALDRAEGLLPRLQGLLVDNWLAVLVIAGAALLWWRGPQIMRAIRAIRTKDARSGAHMGR